MVARHRACALLATLGFLSSWSPLRALPPCGPPGTITTVTAPDGDHLAAFSDYRSYVPKFLASDPAGRLYVADDTIIYRLEADGTATRVVGVPQTRKEQRDNVFVDSVAALEARIIPGAMAFDRAGRLYFVDYAYWTCPNQVCGWPVRIARVEANGQVVTFAGTGELGSSGDGGPAREATFRFASSPGFKRSAMVFDLEDNLLVMDYGNGRIRQIDAEGIVTTLLDSTATDRNGERITDSYETWREKDAPKRMRPSSMVIGPQGSLYFSLGYRVLRRHVDGTIDVVVSGVEGKPSERLDRARDGMGSRYITDPPGAKLLKPSYLGVDQRGTLYISDYYLDRIHRVRPDGTIETIAGNGREIYTVPGCSSSEKPVVQGEVRANPCFAGIGDGGPALEAHIWGPWTMLLTQEGDLLVVATREYGSGFWGGGEFSQLRRVCSVSEWALPTAVEAVQETPSASVSAGTFPSLRLYPNPSNAGVTLTFHLEQSANVSVRIYDEIGQRVRVLAAAAERPAGDYQYVWDGRDREGRRQASGTYLLVLSVDGVQESRKLTLLH